MTKGASLEKTKNFQGKSKKRSIRAIPASILSNDTSILVSSPHTSHSSSNLLPRNTGRAHSRPCSQAFDIPHYTPHTRTGGSFHPSATRKKRPISALGESYGGGGSDVPPPLPFRRIQKFPATAAAVAAAAAAAAFECAASIGPCQQGPRAKIRNMQRARERERDSLRPAAAAAAAFTHARASCAPCFADDPPPPVLVVVWARTFIPFLFWIPSVAEKKYFKVSERERGS